MGVFRSFLVAALIALLSSVASAQSVRCPIPDGENSPIWESFRDYVRANYPQRSGFSARGYALSFGHAMGRLATAGSGSIGDREAFACIEETLDKDLYLRNLRAAAIGGRSSGDLFRLAQEAARGFHDAEVRRITGVTSTAPLHSVWASARGGRVMPPSPPLVPPLPVTPSPPPIPLPPPGPAVGGTSGDCQTGARWSLATANAMMNSAAGKLAAISTEANCNAGAWTACQSAWSDLKVAADHIFQVFDQNHDGVNGCRLCGYGAAERLARRLQGFEPALTSRYFRTAGGFADGVLYSIRSHMSAPLCRVRPPAPPVTPPSPPPVFPPISSSGGTFPSVPGRYTIERVEIPNPTQSFTVTRDGQCTRTVRDGAMRLQCRSATGSNIYDFTIEHSFKLRSPELKPNGEVFLDVQATVSGSSECCSLSSSVWPYLDPPSGKKFSVQTRSGAGKYAQLKNTNLPAAGPNRPVIGPIRAGSASMSATLVATLPSTSDGRLKIRLQNSDGTHLLTYHLRETGR